MGKTILTFLELENPEHLRAIYVWVKTGIWPKEFYDTYLGNLEFENGWQSSLAFTFMKKYIEDRLVNA